MNTESLRYAVRRLAAITRDGASSGSEEPENKLSWGGWLAIVVMVGLLIASFAYALNIWNSIDAAMTGWGWGMLVLGVLTTFLLGSGLMVLVFYSARHDMDR